MPNKRAAPARKVPPHVWAPIEKIAGWQLRCLVRVDFLDARVVPEYQRAWKELTVWHDHDSIAKDAIFSPISYDDGGV